MTNGTDQLLGQLLARTDNLANDVHEIKGMIEVRADRIETRVATLELKHAESAGGTKMMLMFGGAAATVGGLVSTFIGKIWPT
jgi:hypothetical protein